MVRNRKVIFITGVHHTPALEFIGQLQNDKQYHWEIHYLSHASPTDTHLRQTIIPQLQDNFHVLNSVKFDRYNLGTTLLRIPLFFSSLIKSVLLCLRFHPDLIVSFGGYISTPVVIAGFFCGIKTISHEQTLVPGIATRLNAVFNTRLALSFPIPNFYPKKSVVTGNLLRHQIFNTSPVSIDLKKPFIYITGGSQGSDFLNHLTEKLIPRLQKFHIIHQTGHKPVTIPASDRYLSLPYISAENIGPVLNQSEIIISRSGANICSEIHALNKKAILIPLPTAQQNEQLKNARWLRSLHPKTITIIPQSTATAARVARAVTRLAALQTPAAAPPQVNYQLLDLTHELV